MTVNEFAKICNSPLKVLSAYNGKVLCYQFNPDKHAEIGKREISDCVWAEMNVVKSPFGNYARPIMCCYVNGSVEYEKERNKNAKE